ncbi:MULTISPECIES: hypothetical protein [Halorussus]|uniref:hypothetical protein n=1 Tax=Halorussus TaxID=1070314 RepID=UPI0020A13851|nr:hypothetical protein [Halorussus vallis]USZ77752.1 hypothetical protein NGM07_21460 [Halorussus vallis]
MTLPAKRWAQEAIPVAAILLFWNVLSWLFTLDPAIGGTVRSAGTVMALLYVVVRGVVLAPSVSVPITGDVEPVLRENARVALPAGAWFLAAAAVHLLDGIWETAGLPGLHVSPAGWMMSVLAGTGLGVVGLYAVAVGYSTLSAAEASGVAPDASGDD